MAFLKVCLNDIQHLPPVIWVRWLHLCILLHPHPHFHCHLQFPSFHQPPLNVKFPNFRGDPGAVGTDKFDGPIYFILNWYRVSHQEWIQCHQIFYPRGGARWYRATHSSVIRLVVSRAHSRSRSVASLYHLFILFQDHFIRGSSNARILLVDTHTLSKQLRSITLRISLIWNPKRWSSWWLRVCGFQHAENLLS